MKKVLVFGTFDILHPGHIWFLQQARQQGTHLTVVVGRDSVTKKIKGKQSHFNERERLHMIQALSLVDHAILGDQLGKQTVLKRERPDVICWGYDQSPTIAKHFDAKILKVIKQKRISAYHPRRYGSSKISS